MSQYPATQRRTVRRPAHALQHTAIVFAGMTSIGLTVIAGTYVVNQIAESNHRPIAEHRAPRVGMPTGTPQSAPNDPTGGVDSDDDAAAGSSEFSRGTVRTEEVALKGVALAADSSPLPLAPPSAPAAQLPRVGEASPAAPTTAAPTTAAIGPTGHGELPTTAPLDDTTDRGDIGGRVTLPADNYVGANVTTGQPNSVSMTVDTDAFTAFDGGSQDAESRGTPDPTRLRTDLDTDHGAVTVTMSGPATGANLPQRSGPATVPNTPVPEEVPAIAHTASTDSAPSPDDGGEPT